MSEPTDDGTPFARCTCGASYREPLDAARHWAQSGGVPAEADHRFWSVPSAWLDGRPWSTRAFWMAILREDTV
jgi:hypothetical protein